MPNLTAIYSDDLRAFDDALDDLMELLEIDSHAAIPDWLKAHAPLVAEQRSLVATSKLRPRDAHVTLTVVFIDEGGEGQGRLGELLMERIDANATGELYPAVTMAGVRTDADWRGAMEAARKYAAVCGFVIMPGSDVRWSIRVLKAGENLEEHKSRPLEAGEKLTGRSAGVAFFLGLFALAKTDGARGAVDARKVVEYMVALATFPEAEPRTGDDRLGTLGGTEKKKLRALKSLPEGTPVVVVFPMAYPESILIKQVPLPINTIAELAAELRQRSAPPTWPDSLPHSRRATPYIGSRVEVRRLTESLRSSRIHVVSGPGGVGKTARVVEATDALLQEGVFPGGRFWIDLYGAGEPRRKAGKVVAITRGFEAEDKFDELRDQTQRLLAKPPSLVILEGAETVAEKDIAGLLDWFTGPTTLVWMTRRKTDAEHPCLRGAKHHSVAALSPADALKLICICDAPERNVEELSLTERADLEEIAKAAEYLPLLLGWAGAALQSDRGTTPAKYLAELRADPLGSIADPDDRERLNAGRFLRRSLARIVATAEMPDLPTVAKRLFAGLAAFHPSYGAPLSWWPLAAGLDATKPEIAAAKRALRGLGLLTAEDSPPGAGASTKTVHVVHALAGAVAADLWHGQLAPMILAGIGALCEAATTALKTPLPVDWFRNAAWIARRTSEAAHFGHWLNELDIVRSQTAIDDSLAVADSLRQAWVDFLEKHVEPQPLLALKETAWLAVSRHFQQVAAAHPNTLNFDWELAFSWSHLGDVRRARQDWAGAEEAFNEALAISKKLMEANPDAPNFQHGLSVSLVHLGDVRRARQDWAGAEEAFNEALAISKKLMEANPHVPDFQHGLSVSWDNLGDVRRARQDWAGAEEAFNESLAVGKKLAEANPDAPNFQHRLSISWGDLGDVRRSRRDWAGAEEAFNEALAISKKLMEANPDAPNFQYRLSFSWGHLGDARRSRRDWAGAEEAFNEALAISKKLVEAHPHVPDFQHGLCISWRHLGDLRRAGQDWAGAEEAFNEALAISKKLVEAHPDVSNFQHGLSISWGNLGGVRRAGQDWAGAEEAFNESLAVGKKLAEAHPDVPHLQRDLSVSWRYLGDLRRARQDWAGAEEAFNESLAICKKLAEAHPDVPEFQRRLSVSWRHLGDLRRARQDWAGAEEAFNESLAVGKRRARH